MVIKSTHRVGCDEHEFYTYKYDYYIYEFSIDETSLFAECHTEKTETVIFKRFEQNGKIVDMLRYDSPDIGPILFNKAKDYLLTIGKTKFKGFYLENP